MEESNRLPEAETNGKVGKRIDLLAITFVLSAHGSSLVGEETVARPRMIHRGGNVGQRIENLEQLPRRIDRACSRCFPFAKTSVPTAAG